jgi:putative ABC transport system substrate-binding protein
MPNRLPRRRFIAGLGAALASPVAPRAQQGAGGPRRVGVMMAVAEKDPEGVGRLNSFRTALGEAGWVDGKDVTIDAKWYRGSFDVAKASVRELIASGAEVVLVNGTPGMDAMKDVGADMPIVFVVVSNPVGAGYVSNLSRPGGKITGFSTFEPEIVGKWVQILRQVSPDLKHVSMLIDPKFTGFNSLWVALQEISPKQGIIAMPGFASDLKAIESAVETLAGREGPALIVSPSPVNTVNRKRLVELAIQRRVPAIYPFRFYVQDGGLITYGFNATDQFRRAATYVSRILKGESAGDLPVQAPSLFELGVNIKTAKAMGITIPQALLIAADEIVE